MQWCVRGQSCLLNTWRMCSHFKKRSEIDRWPTVISTSTCSWCYKRNSESPALVPPCDYLPCTVRQPSVSSRVISVTPTKPDLSYVLSKTMHHECKMRNWTNQSDLPYPSHGKHAFDWSFDCPCYVDGQATYVQSIQVACPITGKQKFKLTNQMHCYTVTSLSPANLIGQFFCFIVRTWSHPTPPTPHCHPHTFKWLWFYYYHNK